MERKQILFINGGESKDNYKDFREYLEKLEYNPFEEKPKKWRYTFEKDMGDNYEIINPLMPNKGFADYLEWKIMFEKTFPYLKDNIILLGHSQGATFLVKYLNENNFPNIINKIILLAGAFKDSKIEVLGNFNFGKDLKKIKKIENKLFFFHSKDDPVVPFEDLEDFRKILPKSKYYIFENRGHFLGETFFELLDEIKKYS